jgi:hypothetical protein
MVESRDAVDGFGELAPRFALRCQDAGAGRREAVVAAAALAGFLDPAAEDPAALLEAVEQRIEGGDAEVEGAAGPLLCYRRREVRRWRLRR